LLFGAVGEVVESVPGREHAGIRTSIFKLRLDVWELVDVALSSHAFKAKGASALVDSEDRHDGLGCDVTSNDDHVGLEPLVMGGPHRLPPT
jgi:hypothetical protein